MKIRSGSLFVIAFACSLTALVLLGGCTISTSKGKLTVTTTPDTNPQPTTPPGSVTPQTKDAQIASEKGAGGNEPATGTTMTNEQQLAAEHGTALPPTKSKVIRVSMTSLGFTPQNVAINVGDTVEWVNEDSVPHWPASAMHPTHSVYPESGGCIGSKFDACQGIAAGQKFDFVFNAKGSWAYHDHLNPSLYGKVIVQ